MTTKKVQPRYSPELREQAVRMVLAQRKGCPWLWATIEAMAPKFGCAPNTLNEWVKKAETGAGVRPGLTSDQRAKMQALEKKNRELSRASEILRTTSFVENRQDDGGGRGRAGPARSRHASF